MRYARLGYGLVALIGWTGVRRLVLAIVYLLAAIGVLALGVLHPYLVGIGVLVGAVYLVAHLWRK